MRAPVKGSHFLLLMNSGMVWAKSVPPTEQSTSAADRESITPGLYEGNTAMKSHIFAFSALTIAITLATPRAFSQSPALESTALNVAPGLLHADSFTSSGAFVTVPPRPLGATRTYRPFSGLGLATRVGFAGTGFDAATPLATRFNLRAGTDFLSYATNFQEEGANVGVNLRLRSGHAALDWFPFGGHFRLSSQLVFGNNNRILATAIIPSGSTVTLNGQDYTSSYTDPLHGSGRIDFRKVSPGLSLGFGNLIPRDRNHFSIPVEVGFYYVGQPNLQVAFVGSACDPNYPPSAGCHSVDQDPGFQKNLAAFRARNDNNLSYASFFPIFSLGFGYRFW
jgi:hypothetical protein